MKILVVLSHGLYLRNFQSPLGELARRGHQVEIAFSAPRPLDDAAVADSAAAAISQVAYPQRTGWWWPAADSLRGVRDYVHYLGPEFDRAPRLVERAARRVPGGLRKLLRRGGFWAKRRASLNRLLGRLDAAIPPDPGLTAWLAERAPDLVAVSPLVDHNYDQLDLVKAARAAGLATVHLVASWDNLTSKGQVHIAADRVVVWNDWQKREAADLHGIPPAQIAVTGAQLYDHWFAMAPRDDRAAFCRRIGGADPGRPIILYVGSSPFICPDETAIFTGWLAALRAAGGSRRAGATVLVRPHPLHAPQWAGLDLAAFAPVFVWPPAGAMPIAADDQHGYFDSLFHAAAVVGVNTSAFLEAGIVGRPIFSLEQAAGPGATAETLHLRHLLDGGLVAADPNIATHFVALEQALGGVVEVEARRRAFLAAFLRPHGITRPATPLVADAVEAAAGHALPPERGSLLLRALLAPIAAVYLRPRYRAALAWRARS